MKCPTKCPKCGSENVDQDQTKNGQIGYNCQNCDSIWTSWQQQRIEDLREGLKKLEWSWNLNSCPVCKQGNPKEGILAKQFLGHKPDCWLKKLIEGE